MMRRAFLVGLVVACAGCYLRLERAMMWRDRVGTWGEQVAPWRAR